MGNFSLQFISTMKVLVLIVCLSAFFLLNEACRLKACQMCRPPGGTVLTKIITKRSPNVKCAHHRVIEISREKREVDPNRKCWSIMENSGIESAYFPYATAHRIHSMSLQDLRNFFDPEAPEINGIPTIVEGIVVNNTMEDSSPFNSDGLRGLASALSESKDLENSDVLLAPKLIQMILHPFHMQEMWTNMKPMYDELVKNPPKNKQLCPCVKDVKNNQVWKYLEWMASGEGVTHEEEDEYLEYGYNASNNNVNNYWMNSVRLDLLQYNDEKSDLYSAAVFIYCMLNE